MTKKIFHTEKIILNNGKIKSVITDQDGKIIDRDPSKIILDKVEKNEKCRVRKRIKNLKMIMETDPKYKKDKRIDKRSLESLDIEIVKY